MNELSLYKSDYFTWSPIPLEHHMPTHHTIQAHAANHSTQTKKKSNKEVEVCLILVSHIGLV